MQRHKYYVLYSNSNDKMNFAWEQQLHNFLSLTDNQNKYFAICEQGWFRQIQTTNTINVGIPWKAIFTEFNLLNYRLKLEQHEITLKNKCRGYKTFFMLNGPEHEIYPAIKY